MITSSIEPVLPYLCEQKNLQKGVEFAYHMWRHFKSFPLYAQDPKIAYSSLVIANLLIFQLTKCLAFSFQYFLLNKQSSEDKQHVVEWMTNGLACITIVGAVTLFAIKTQLPFPYYVTLAVSAATLASRILLEIVLF